MSDQAYPDGTFERSERVLERWAPSTAGEVMVSAARAEWDLERRRVTMKFAWVDDNGVPPVDTYGSMIYPQAFAHIDYGVPLVRNHDWGQIIGTGQVRVDEREAWIRGELGADDDANKAEGTLEMLASAGVNLECSVSMRPSTAKIRRGAELTDAEVAALEDAGWPRAMGWAIDYADIVEVSWVLAGSVPDTEVALRSEVDTAEGVASEGGVTIIAERDHSLALLALAVAEADAQEVLK